MPLTRAAAVGPPPRPAQGTIQMFRNDGLRGMFKGNGLNCIRIIPNQGEGGCTGRVVAARV